MAKFKHHSYFQKTKALQAFRFPFVCFACRKSYKYPAHPVGRICPQCAGPLEMLSRKFSAPKAKDVVQWRKVQYLVEHGFRFQSAYECIGFGSVRVKYPATLAEAKEFVAKLGGQRARAA